MKTPSFKLRAWLLLWSFTLLVPALLRADVGYNEPITVKPNGDIFQIFNVPAGNEFKIHGVTQAGATFMVKVTISGALIGATRIPVTFASALSAAPAGVARPVLQKSSTNQDNVDVINVDTLSTTGFFVNLSGPAISGQVLHCLVFAP